MEAVYGVVLRWAFFAGAHIGLGTTRVRAAVVGRLGENGFAVVFSSIAALTFAPLVRFYAAHRFEGPAGIAAGEIVMLRWLLIALVTGSVTLAVAALFAFRPSTLPAFGARVPEVHGLDRITRHPFFAGVAALGFAHTLLASRLVGTVFFGALTAFTLIGMRAQDRKLLRQRGEPYARYVAATSAMPFAAVAAGRQTLVWSELPWGGLIGGFVGAVLLRFGHDGILARDGLWVVIAVVGGAFSIMVRGFWRNLRRRGAIASRSAA